MRFCPYAERSVLVLNAKNLQYDVVFINLDNKPEWIFQYSPKGKYAFAHSTVYLDCFRRLSGGLYRLSPKQMAGSGLSSTASTIV